MEIQQQRGVGNSKVVKVQNKEAWELFTNQASNEGRPSVSSKYGVKAMPTFFLIKNKEVVSKIIGANPDELKKLVEASADPYPPETQIVVE